MESDNTINRVINLVFRALGELDYFDGNGFKSGWRLRWDSGVLSCKGYRAATTAEGSVPVIVLSEDFSLERDLDALVHEAIHMAQIIKGKFVPSFGDGYSTWNGTKYKNLPFNHPKYFSDQPWEQEVAAMIPRVIAKMSESNSS